MHQFTFRITAWAYTEDLLWWVLLFIQVTQTVGFSIFFFCELTFYWLFRSHSLWHQIVEEAPKCVQVIVYSLHSKYEQVILSGVVSDLSFLSFISVDKWYFVLNTRSVASDILWSCKWCSCFCFKIWSSDVVFFTYKVWASDVLWGCKWCFVLNVQSVGMWCFLLLHKDMLAICGVITYVGGVNESKSSNIINKTEFKN